MTPIVDAMDAAVQATYRNAIMQVLCRIINDPAGRKYQRLQAKCVAAFKLSSILKSLFAVSLTLCRVHFTNESQLTKQRLCCYGYLWFYIL